MSAPKTKEMVALLKNLKVDRKALFITADPEKMYTFLQETFPVSA
jgi:ribosomal protein L4